MRVIWTLDHYTAGRSSTIPPELLDFPSYKASRQSASCRNTLSVNWQTPQLVLCVNDEFSRGRTTRYNISIFPSEEFFHVISTKQGIKNPTHEAENTSKYDHQDDRHPHTVRSTRYSAGVTLCLSCCLLLCTGL